MCGVLGSADMGGWKALMLPLLWSAPGETRGLVTGARPAPCMGNACPPWLQCSSCRSSSLICLISAWLFLCYQAQTV